MRAVLASVLAVVFALGAGTQPVLGRPSTGNVVVFYGGNTEALFATLTSGELQGTYLMTGAWSSVALTSSSVALYKKSTGKLRLGYVVDGVPTFTSTKTIGAGYTSVVGGCDSVFFYNSNTGGAFSATLFNGVLGVKHARTMAKGFDLAAASCDTLYLQDQGHSEQTYFFSNGKLSSKVVTSDAVDHALLAATNDSLLRQSSTAGGNGDWGVLAMGIFNKSGGLSDFAQWDAIGGTSDQILYYRSDGSAAWAKLTSGSYSFQGPVSGITKTGFNHVVGGK